MVAVGLYNGDIEVYRVQVEKNYQNYEDVKKILKINRKRIQRERERGNSDVLDGFIHFFFILFSTALSSDIHQLLQAFS